MVVLSGFSGSDARQFLALVFSASKKVVCRATLGCDYIKSSGYFLP